MESDFAEEEAFGFTQGEETDDDSEEEESYGYILEEVYDFDFAGNDMLELMRMQEKERHSNFAKENDSEWMQDEKDVIFNEE